MRPCNHAERRGLLQLLPVASLAWVLAGSLVIGSTSIASAQDCGDCNGDGVLNISDALAMARIATGIIIPTSGQLALCDIDSSGQVNPIDTLLMAQFAAGQPGIVLNCPPQGVPFFSGTQPLTVRLDDINLDGHFDILVGLDPPGVDPANPGMVRIHYGMAGASGSTSIDWSMATIEDVINVSSNSGVSSILSGDIDHDGLPDMLTVEFETGSFTFWPGTQACPGVFDSFGASVPQTVLASGPIIWGGRLFDMDLDGDLDFVTIGAINGIAIFKFDSSLGVFSPAPVVLTPGLGQLGPCTLVVPFDPIGVALGDFTENGMPDIVGAYVASSRLVLFEQIVQNLIDTTSADRGRGTTFSSCDDDESPAVFRQFETSGPMGLGAAPAAVHAGDVDRDGHLDIVSVGSFSGSVSLLLGDGEGGFAPPVVRDFGLGPIGLVLNSQLIDLNRDGVLDLVATSEASDEIFFLQGAQPIGTTTFQFLTPRRFPTSLAAPGAPTPIPTNPAGVDVADLDEDGANDIVVATTRTGEFQIIDLTTFGGLTPRQFIAFNTAISYEVGAAGPVDIASGSLIASDAFADIVTANSDGSLSFFRGFETEGAGLAFPPLVQMMPSVISSPSAVTVGELNGLIDSDVAVADRGANSVVVFLHNASTSTVVLPFLAPTTYALPTGPSCSPSDIKIADVTGDGRNDIIVSCEVRNSVIVLPNSAVSPGSFGAGLEFDTGPAIDPVTRQCSPGNFAGCRPTRLAIGDVDNVNGNDIVTGNIDSYDVAILLNDGIGNMSLAGLPAGLPPTGTPSRISAVCLADFDGDGNEDYAVAHANPGGSFSNVYLFAGNGQGGFAPAGSAAFAAALVTGLGISDVECRDLDSDGDPDLVIATRVSGIISVARNRINEPGAPSAFTFDPLNCPAGGNPIAVTIADVSGDGNLDILTANPPDSVTFVPGRPGGRFVCTLTQTIPGGLMDIALGRLDEDAHEDFVAVVLGPPNQVVVGYGRGLSGQDESTRDDDVFEYEPVTTPEDFTITDLLLYGGSAILAVDTGDYDQDGDNDIAVLYGNVTADPLFGQVYTGPAVEIFYNIDKEDRGTYTNVIADFHILFTFLWRPVLPLLNETGAQIAPYALGLDDFNHAFDLITRDVNQDGLLDFIALLPSDGGAHPDSLLVVTLTPGITGSPNDISFDPPRFIDFQGFTEAVGCMFHGHGAFGTQYAPAVSPPNGCIAPDARITQFSFNLGPIDASSVTFTDAYPTDGLNEIVVTDRTNGQLLIFEVDHTVPLATPGQAALDLIAPMGGVPLGYPRGVVTGPMVIGPFSTGVGDVAHGDVNNDGRPDMVAGLFANPAMADRGFLALDQPDCMGAVPGVYGITEFAGRKFCVLVDSDDYNRDGKQDALLVSQLGEVASAFYFDEMLTPGAMGQLTPRVDHVIGAGEQSDLVKDDVNNDGRIDVIITTNSGSQLTILLGSF